MKIDSDFFKLILENTHEGIVITDDEYTIVHVNEKARQFHNWYPNMEWKNWQSYFTVYESDGITPTPLDQLPLVRAMQGESVVNSYHYIKFRDRESILVKYNTRIFKIEDKKFIVLSIQDCQDLAESLTRFQSIFEQSPYSMMIISRDGKVIRVNSAYKKLWGLSSEMINSEIINKYNLLNDPVLISQGISHNVLRVFSGESVDFPEVYFNPLDVGLPGRARWTVGSMYPIRDNSGAINEAIVIQQDISEHKFNKIEKIKLQSQLEAILRQLPVGVMVTDNDNVLFHNGAMNKIIGTVNETKVILKGLKNDPAISKELSVLRPNRATTHFTITSGPIRDPDDKPIANVYIATDISEGKRIKSNQEFLAQVKNLLISTLELDQVLERVANSAVAYIAEGCMVDIVEGNKINRIISKHRNPLKHSLLEKLQREYPPTFDSPQPSARTIVSGSPILINETNSEVVQNHCYNDEHANLIQEIGMKSFISVPLEIRGEIIGSINLFNPPYAKFYDEVDLSLAQELARNTAIAIDNANLFKDTKNAIQLRDDFISVASHELRTPITSLLLQIDVLNSLVADMDPHCETAVTMKKFLGNTSVQLNRLTRLVEDMLDISRINSKKLSLNISEINLKELLCDVLERFEDQLKFYSISTQLTGVNHLIYSCDRERMDQVITNFLTNAIKYGQGKPIELHLEESLESVIIKVKDHGKGIAPHDHERIFNQFERIAPAEDINGLGLGLYINNHIVREHGGKIKVCSDINKGAIFTVELPKDNQRS